MTSSRLRHRWIALATGLLALCLQLAAQVMPAEAMQGAMRAAALTADEAQSFAATCLGLGVPGKSGPVKLDQHGSCPICFTLAQAQGSAAPVIDFTAVPAWTGHSYQPVASHHASVQAVARAFNSQAPPAAAI